MRAVDCQGFAGGFTLGVVQAGFELVGKRELPGGFGAASCLANRALLGESWDYEEAPWEEWSPVDVELVFGNPPCSGFSLLSHKDFRGPDSPINSCMWALARYAVRCRPQVVAFESVQGAFKQGRELMVSLRALLERETGDHWTLYHVLHNAYSVGGPSIRRRYFFVASRVPFGVETYRLDRVPTVDDVIGDLRDLSIRIDAQPYARSDASWWVEDHELRRRDGRVDGHVTLDNLNTSRIRQLIELGDWKSGETLSEVARRVWETRADDWTDDRLQQWAERDFRLGYNQSYRWYPDRAPRVVTGGACQHVVHPHEPRCLTLREVYRIQGFPDSWLLEPAVALVDGSVNKASMWPGKGIPVQAGRWLGEWIKRALEGDPGCHQGDVIGRGERVIDVTNDFKTVWDERHHTPTDSRNAQVLRAMEERCA